MVARCRPAAVWLFAPDEELKPHRDIVSALRKLDPRPVIFVQIGNVVAAREAAEDGADVVVCQGIDAGGHQFRRGSGVAALVPEVCRMLAQEFAEKSIAVFAAGGIAEGRGVAAMLALGNSANSRTRCCVCLLLKRCRWDRDGNSRELRLGE